MEVRAHKLVQTLLDTGGWLPQRWKDRLVHERLTRRSISPAWMMLFPVLDALECLQTRFCCVMHVRLEFLIFMNFILDIMGR